MKVDFRACMKKRAVFMFPPEISSSSFIHSKSHERLDDKSRLKERSGMFKLKSSETNTKSETSDMQKIRRQENLEKVRKLQIAKERFFAFKIGGSINNSKHDSQYNSSSEI